MIVSVFINFLLAVVLSGTLSVAIISTFRLGVTRTTLALVVAERDMALQQKQLAEEDVTFIKTMYRDKKLYAQLSDEQFISLARVVKGAIEAEKTGAYLN